MSFPFPSSWNSFFDEQTKKLFLEILDKCKKDCQKNNTLMVPNEQDLLKMMELTPPNKINVVIFSLDPYTTMIVDSQGNQRPKANGIAYGLSENDKELPNSLQKIYQLISNDIPEFEIPKHGNLTSWCQQGVLLLNCSLTARRGSPLKHVEFWKPFISKLLEFIGNERPRCIYLLWGNDFIEYEKFINTRNDRILCCSNPMTRNGNFLTCGHFQKVDDFILEECSNESIRIDWQI